MGIQWVNYCLSKIDTDKNLDPATALRICLPGGVEGKLISVVVDMGPFIGAAQASVGRDYIQRRDNEEDPIAHLVEITRRAAKLLLQRITFLWTEGLQSKVYLVCDSPFGKENKVTRKGASTG